VPCGAGYGGSYFSPPWNLLLPLQTDNASMQESSNSLAQEESAWCDLYRRTVLIVNQNLEEKGLDKIEAVCRVR